RERDEKKGEKDSQRQTENCQQTAFTIVTSKTRLSALYPPHKPNPVKASREPPSTNLSPIRYFAFACQTRNRLISVKGGSTKSLLTPRPFGISNSRSFAMIFEHFIVPRNNACA
ncbi:hypothetical protein ALC62_08905, partial [Cyphomyrmex costatus]